jgi:GT2 family glycosyltransferase
VLLHLVRGYGVTDRANVAVVVASRDRPEMVERCLASLRAALRPEDELVLVDSASADPLAYSNAAARNSARLVRMDVPGVNRARNAGWRSTTAPLVLFTDDDVVVDVGWADAFADAFARDPSAGFLTGRLDTPEGQTGTVATTEGTEEKVLTPQTRGVLGHGASMAVRRGVLEQIGGWDDALGAGGRFRSAPELDVFDRVFAAGWTGRYVPSSLAEHEQWRSDAQVARLQFR